MEFKGRKLKGFVQVRKRRNRLQSVTVCGKHHVIGTKLDWLAEQNGIVR